MEDEIEEELSREKEVVGERKRWLMTEMNVIEKIIKVLKRLYDKETYTDYRELIKSCINTLNDLLKLLKTEYEEIEILEELEIE